MSDDRKLKMAAARYLAVERQRYLASALFSLQLREKAEGMPFPTMATAKNWITYYHPDYVDQNTVEELAWTLIHEIWHLLREHHEDWRVGGKEALIWNLSGDCAINDGLQNIGLKVPKGVALPSNFKLPDDQLEEQYYDELIKKAKKVTISVGTSTHCGGCADGQHYPYEDPNNGQGQLDPKTGKGQKSRGISPAEADLIKREVARAVQNDPNRGTIPGDIQRWAEKLLKPTIPWEREFRAAIRGAFAAVMGAVDYSRRRPNRRQVAYGPIQMPTLRRPLPRVSAVIDTSGSMSEKMLERAVSECHGALQTLGIPMTVFSCDAAAGPAQKVLKASQIQLTGGGGTDIGCGIEAALANKKDPPDILVIITDCYTPWPDDKPNVPQTILVDVAGGRGNLPPWPVRTIQVPIE